MSSRKHGTATKNPQSTDILTSLPHTNHSSNTKTSTEDQILNTTNQSTPSKINQSTPSKINQSTPTKINQSPIRPTNQSDARYGYAIKHT